MGKGKKNPVMKRKIMGKGGKPWKNTLHAEKEGNH